MQGKERNNHQIDTGFQDFAWSEMSALLDKEMPVAPVPVAKPAPYRRYAVFAVLLLLGFFSGVGTMLLLDKEKPSTPELEPIQRQEPQKIAEGSTDHSNLSNAETDQLIAQQERSQQVEQQIRENLSINPKTNKNVENLYINSSSVTSEPYSQSRALSFTDETVIVLLDNATNSSEKQTISDIDDLSNQVIDKPWLISTDELATSPLTELDTKESFIDLAYLPANQAPKWSFGAFVSSHTRDWSGAHGWSTGLMASYRMDRAFSFRTGLSYSQLTGFRSTSFGINEPLTHTYFEPLDGTGLDYSSVSSLEGNQDLPFQSLHYVDVPLGLHYQMSRRVGVLMGVRMSYLLDTQMDDYVSAALDDNGKELLDQALYGSMRKFDVATVLGLSIYPTQNIGLEIKYNHGLIDYTKDQLWHIRQLNTNKTFELGLHYTIR
jgi:hypothetical protein